jgi:hypothetical protein
VLVDQVHRGKISFTYLFDRFKQIVEASLVEERSQGISPKEKDFLVFFVFKGDNFSESLELDGDGFAESILLFGLGSFELENEIKVEGNLVRCSLVLVLDERCCTLGLRRTKVS